MEHQARPPLHELAREPWDLLVIGGGITGAGIFREATALGLRTLLVERDDIAAGTSSHSAKLVHGGLHYLSRFQVGLARESIRERDHLLQEGAGLIDAIDFLLPVAAGDWKHECVTTIGLGVYHAIGGRLRSSPAPTVDQGELEQLAPGIDSRFRSAHRYLEGQTDDARLTLRVLNAGQRNGGIARTYTTAVALSRNRHCRVNGAELHDQVSGETAFVPARFVVNATGPWSDLVRAGIGRLPRQRIVGGSHIVIPHDRLPLRAGVAVYHPSSGLPLYIVPWRGVTLVGTTHAELSAETCQPHVASTADIAYLLDGVNAIFTGLHLMPNDLRAAFTGARPIIDTQTSDPARASRDYGIWVEDGLITVTGGKLTTHRSVARQAMRLVSPRLLRWSGDHTCAHSLCEPRDRHDPGPLSEPECRRLSAQYGPEALAAIMEMSEGEHVVLPGVAGLTLAELRWAARSESVLHLDDLLARRTRIALTAPGGGADLLHLIEPIARQELGWDAPRWQSEVSRYRAIWESQYAPARPSASPSRTADTGLRQAS